MPEEEREAFAGAVTERIVAADGDPLLDYVRLNMTASRAGGGA